MFSSLSPVPNNYLWSGEGIVFAQVGMWLGALAILLIIRRKRNKRFSVEKEEHSTKRLPRG